MSNEKNMDKYSVRTDLAIELVKDGTRTEKGDNVVVTDITLDEEEAKKINKKPGHYVTIEFSDITDYDNGEEIKNVFAEAFKEILAKIKIGVDDTCLIIGLGNEKSTPDAVGPFTISNIIVTNYLYVCNELDEGFRRVWALSPGVMGETGMETSDLIKGVVKEIKPDFVITVDALASSSIERVNKTIQMTDAGINPGSGVGNKRKEISKDTLGIPVIAVGVPTVVDAASIVSDTIRFMYDHFSYHSNGQSLKNNDRKNLFGLVGELSDNEVKSFIYEILNPIGYNLMVTPKEEDFVVEKLSEVIGEGINKSLHKQVD